MEPANEFTASSSRKLTLHEVADELLKEKILNQEQHDQVLFQQRLNPAINIHPLILIANQEFESSSATGGKLSLEYLTEWLADHVKLPYLRIDPLKIDVTKVTQIMSSAYATRYKVLPVEVHAEYVVIATCEPYDREWEEAITHSKRTQIKRVIMNPKDIARYTNEFYGVSQSILKATSEKDGEDLSKITNFEQLIELGKAGKLDVNDQHVVHIVDWLLQYAFDQRASDIHIEPRRDAGNIRFRIDGVLHTVNEMPGPVMAAVTSRIKTLGRMDVVERRRPQDGRIKTKTPNGNEVELRISTMPTAFGEKMVMRIFDPDVLVKDFSQLGFTDSDTEKWQHWVKKPHGIILVTGPTGSGKTTTLYSTLKYLATNEVNVSTVEDPIEMVSPEFNQMQVEKKIGVTFASGIRTLLRQDPDIIMVGEIRDIETAEMATQAALTGHLVLSTLHTNDAPSAITRLLDLGLPPYLIKSTVIGIMAQRLVRTLCPYCKKPHTIEDSIWEGIITPWKFSKPETIYKAEGCLECRDTGYLGRIGIYEILSMSSSIKDLITHESDLTQIRKQAYKEGMEPLRLSGARKIHSGITTPDEIIRVAPTDEDL